MKSVKELFGEFCLENNLNIDYSVSMPKGYEEAFGTFDITTNTLYYNEALLNNTPSFEQIYYLYHELRHADQYINPEKYDEMIVRSSKYVIMYDGVCYKLISNSWKGIKLKGNNDYFTKLYLNQPYEIDANSYAYKKTKELLGESIELDKLYKFWVPKEKIDYSEFIKLYDAIDQKIK